MNLLASALSAALAFVTSAGAAPANPATLAPDAVVVLAPLHALHTKDPDFTYGDLEHLLTAAAPDVLVVETRPDELSGRTDTPGRPEYPAVVWPWVEKRKVTLEPMEPGGETFATMVAAAGDKYERFRRQRPDAASTVTALQSSLTQALLEHWRHPADAHDQHTRNLARAAVLVEQALGGPGEDAGQAAWDSYMISRAKAVIAASPGQRVVVLASYRNQAAFLRGLSGEPRLQDAEAWIRGLTFPARSSPEGR